MARLYESRYVDIKDFDSAIDSIKEVAKRIISSMNIIVNYDYGKLDRSVEAANGIGALRDSLSDKFSGELVPQILKSRLEKIASIKGKETRSIERTKAKLAKLEGKLKLKNESFSERVKKYL